MFSQGILAGKAFLFPLVIAKCHIMVNMATELTLDKLGRIVLPKPVREKLQLAAGDQLELESLDDRITPLAWHRAAQKEARRVNLPLWRAAFRRDRSADYRTIAQRTRRARLGTNALRGFFDISVLIPVFFEHHERSLKA
jgi:AbrB family looped-hinge helix DNA binding protein